MVHTNTKVQGKRKSGTEEKVEPLKKALKKNEIIQEYEILKEKYDKVMEENKKNLEDIVLLEETIKLLRDQNLKKASNAVGVQTEDTERLWCIECEYPAEDLYDLGEHMYEVHAEDNSEYTESCHYCGNCFKTRGDLMTHNKKTHSEKIQLCRNNLEGKCDFVESDCWFSHDVKAQKSSQLYTCNICKKTFKLRSDSMYHRKQEHKEIVPQCKNKESCKFDNAKCWYLHNEQNEKNVENHVEQEYDNNQLLLEKIFDMVEKMTERILKLENPSK